MRNRARDTRRVFQTLIAKKLPQQFQFAIAGSRQQKPNPRELRVESPHRFCQKLEHVFFPITDVEKEDAILT